MAESSPAVAHDLSHYIRPLRRHWLLLFSCLGLVILLSAALALQLRPTYTAVAKVQVTANITDQSANQTGGRTNGIINMDTQTQLVRSLPVAMLAQKTMKTATSPQALDSRVTVTVPPNTTILAIAFSAHSLSVATAGANAFAAGYLANREANAKKYQADQIAAVNISIADGQKTLIALTTQAAASPPTSAAHHQAELKKTTEQTTLFALAQQLGTLKSASVTPGDVISSATAGGGSPNEKRELVIIAGIVLGVLLGIAAASFRDSTDRSVRSEDDLAREHVRLLGEIKPTKRAMLRKRAAVKAQALVARTRAEQRVAATIGAALGDKGGTVYVAALSPAVADDRFAQRLAAELSRFGSSTEIVTLGSTSAGASRSGQHEPAPAERQPAAALRSDDDEPAAFAKALGWPTSERSTPGGSQLAPLPSGRNDAFLAQRSSPPVDDISSIMHEVQAALSRSRYVVLVGADTPYGSEAYILASLSQASVLIVEPGVTTRAHLADVVEQVSVTSSALLGALLWRPLPKRLRASRGPIEPSPGVADRQLSGGAWSPAGAPVADDAILTRPSNPAR